MARYRCIAKVGKDKFVKYKVTNLVKFASFLDKDFEGWRYFNVYEYVKKGKGRQLASFTQNNRPISGNLSRLK